MVIDCHLQHIQRDKHTLPVLIRTQTHRHDELTYFISGKGSTQIGETVYPYKARTFAYYKAGTLHDEYDPEPCQVIWMHFDFHIEGISLREGVFEDPHGELFALIQRLRNVSLEQKEHRAVLEEGCLAEVIVMATRLQSTFPSARTVTDWQQILNDIDENSNTAIDFTALATRYHYSYDRFRHLFCEKFGMSPYAYLLRQRIEHAVLLLESTDSALTEIAFDCGFNSSSQFTNIFKKHMGSTPGEYRKKHRSS